MYIYIYIYVYFLFSFARFFQVYDVTDFLDDHPGGGESITISAGQDSSEEFNALHSDKARAMLEDYYIGDLDTSVAKPAVSANLWQ